MTNDDWITVCKVDDLVNGEPLGARINEAEIVVVRTEASVHALAGLCTHDHARLCLGRVANGALVCPRHGATFRLEDGQCQAGFRLAPLERYQTRIIDGLVQVRSSEVRLAPKVRWDLSGGR